MERRQGFPAHLFEYNIVEREIARSEEADLKGKEEIGMDGLI